MESLLHNKMFIRVSIAFVGLITIFVLAKGISEFGYGEHKKNNSTPNVISVSGDGEIFAVPDIATFSFSVEKEAKTMAEAQKLVSKNVDSALSFLKGKGILDKDIKTENYNAYPKYDYTYEKDVACGALTCPPRPGKQIISGYTVSESITVKVRNTDLVSDVTLGLTKAEVSNLNGPNWSVDDEDLLKDQAREKAITDAKAKAKLLANQLGVRLGDITSFSENNGGYPIMYAKTAMMGVAEDASLPAPQLPKGENKITSNVTITYEIK